MLISLKQQVSNSKNMLMWRCRGKECRKSLDVTDIET